MGYEISQSLCKSENDNKASLFNFIENFQKMAYFQKQMA